MPKYLLPVVVFFLSILTGHAQQSKEQYIQERVDALTEEAGWVINSRVMIAGAQVPKDMLKGMAQCAQTEVLMFKPDMTYVRTNRKKSCASVLQETNGTWSYTYDTASYPGILTMRLMDLVDPRLSKNYSIGSIAPGFQKDGMLMLTPMPDDKPMEAREVTVYRREKSAVFRGLISLKREEIEEHGQIANIWNLDRRMENLGILDYYYLKKDVGPYHVISYVSNTEEAYKEYLVEMHTDSAGSRLAIYDEKPTGWRDATGAILGDDFTAKTLKAGFELWRKKYSDGTVAANRSDQQLLYSLSSSNFLTTNPEIYVEIKVAWVDRNGQEKEDSKLIGSLNFNKNILEFIWNE